MSDKKETPLTNQPPAAPTTSNKVGKRQRQRQRPRPPRAGKKIRRKELEKVLASGADAASGAAPASSAGPGSSTPPAASSAAATTSAPGNTGVAVPAVGLAHHTTIASLVPELQLMDDETTALARYLPDIITAFVQGRRTTLKVP